MTLTRITTSSAIILSSVRTGSTWLGESLNQHPAITYDKELLLEVRDRGEQEKIDYLVEHLRVCATQWHLWKLQAYQAWLGLLEGIETDRDTAIVHLWRDNIFNQYVSAKVGEQTKVYTRRVGDPAPDVEPFALDADDLEHFMEKEFAWRKTIRSWFTERDRFFELSYEKLCQDYQNQLRLIFEMLDLRPVSVFTPTLKMQERDQRKLITNYRELCDRFRGTKFENCGFIT